MIGYVYVLCSCKTGKHYCGSAGEPPRRLEQHNANAVAATRGKGPWQFVRLYEFEELKAARKAEVYIKREKSADVMRALATGTLEWPPQFAGQVVRQLSSVGRAADL